MRTSWSISSWPRTTTTCSIFTQKGRVYWMRVFDIPEGSRQSKGRAIQNLVQLEGDDKVVAYLNVTDLKSEEYLENHFVVLCTKKGVIKKTTPGSIQPPAFERYHRREASARRTNCSRHASPTVPAISSWQAEEGKAVHFNEADIRGMGRNSSGVRGMRLGSAKDEVVGMVTVDRGGDGRTPGHGGQ